MGGLWGSICWSLASCGGSPFMVGILRLPGVQSFCPRAEGASWPSRSFPPAQGQGIGRVDVPHSGSDGWGGHLPCPSPSREHQASPTSTVAVFVQRRLPLLILHTPAVPLPPARASACTREGSRAAGRSPLLTVRIFSMSGQTTG